MIKVQNNPPATKFTQHKASNLTIKDETKYLYTKNQQLGQQLFHLSLTLTNSWNNLWLYIQHTIEEKLKRNKIKIKKT